MGTVRTIQGAATRGDIPKLEELLNQGVRINHINSSGWYPLAGAVRAKQYKMSRYLLENGANINILSKCHWSPLYIAVWRRDLHMVRLLLSYHPRLNTKTLSDYNSPWGYTPLHLACQNGDTKIVLELIKAGAKVNIKDGQGTSPLDTAIQNGKYKTALCMALKGAVLKYEQRMPDKVESFYYLLKS